MNIMRTIKVEIPLPKKIKKESLEFNLHNMNDPLYNKNYQVREREIKSEDKRIKRINYKKPNKKPKKSILRKKLRNLIFLTIRNENLSNELIISNINKYLSHYIIDYIITAAYEDSKDETPQYDVFFRTKKRINIIGNSLLNKVSKNTDGKKTIAYVKKVTTNVKITIEYIKKKGNYMTVGTLPEFTEKDKITYYIVNKLLNKNASIEDIINENPGFAMMNMEKIYKIQNQISNLKIQEFCDLSDN